MYFKARNVVKWVLWSVTITFIVFFLSYVLPHRGFDYTDHGFYLYDNINLANGIVPQYGYYSILNIIPYALGLNYYLVYEIYNSLFIILATSIIFYSYGLHKSIIYPLTLLVMLVLPNILMITYQNVPSFLLIVSFGLVILAKKRSSFLLSILALCVLCFSSFANIALLPSIISNLIVFMILNKRRKLLFIIYIVFCLILLYFYLNSPINIFSFARGNPNHHFVSDHHLISNIYQLINVVLFSNNYIFLILFSFAIVLRIIIFYINKNQYLICLFVFMVMYIYILFFMKITDYPVVNLGFANVLSLFLAIVLLTTKDNKNLLVFSVITLIYAAGLGSSGFLNVTYHVSLMGPSALILIVLFVYSDLKVVNHIILKNAIKVVFFVSLTIIFGILLIDKLKDSYLDVGMFYTNNEIKHGYLRGVYTQPSKEKAYNDIINFYNKFDCSSRSLIAFPAMPLIYAMFNRQAFGNQAWVDPAVGFNVSSDNLLEYTKGLKHWCVILALQFNSPQDYTQKYKEFVTAQSLKCFALNYNAVGQPGQLYFCYK